jgi:hypothetical protein
VEETWTPSKDHRLKSFTSCVGISTTAIFAEEAELEEGTGVARREEQPVDGGGASDGGGREKP